MEDGALPVEPEEEDGQRKTRHSEDAATPLEPLLALHEEEAREREHRQRDGVEVGDPGPEPLGSVEVQEVDCILKRASNSEMVVSLAWRIKNGIAERIVSYIAESKEQEKARILEYCRNTLPPYMVPHDIFFIDKIPLNDNGKFDKQKLINILLTKT